MYLLTHPEAVENELIDLTNFYLKVARTQLRNTTTRRLRRKEKEDTEKMSDETEVSEI